MLDGLLRCAALLAWLAFAAAALAGCEQLRLGSEAFNAQMANPGYGRVYDCRGGCTVYGPVRERY
jgi:hypothetical protein